MRAPELILVRHGQSVANAEHRLQGSRDSPLSEIGMNEAAGLAAWLKETVGTVDRVFASPLSRAHATAAFISDLFDVGEPTIIPQAHEVNMGELQGTIFEDARLKFPELRDSPMQEMIEFSKYGGETREQITGRISATLRELDSAYANGANRLVLVSHGVFGSHFIQHLICSNEPESFGVFLTNCTSTLLRFSPGLKTQAQLIWHVNGEITGLMDQDSESDESEAAESETD